MLPRFAGLWLVHILYDCGDRKHNIVTVGRETKEIVIRRLRRTDPILFYGSQ
jgi:hypothetical protein